jgi:hypothetical protein
MLTTAQTTKKYGVPNETGAGYLVTLNLPYPMRLAWDTDETVTRMRCHKLVAPKFEAVFKELLTTYGLPRIKELGIDLFGGCFNYRKMRGGSAWSKHSWGIAIDLDPARNGLKTTYAKSQFAKPEYKKLHEIFEKHGFINLGKTKGFDTMHWEINN